MNKESHRSTKVINQMHSSTLSNRFLLLTMFCMMFLLVSLNTQATESKKYNIAEGTLGKVLSQFGAQSGILLTFDPELTKDKTSGGLSGQYTLEQGLDKLLVGSGIAWTFTQSNAVTLQLQKSNPRHNNSQLNESVLKLDTLSVAAVLSGEKIQRSYRDTFTSVGVVTQEDMDNYHISDLHESFNHLANVRYFHNNQGNSGFQIRGLNADGVTQPANSAPLISVIIDGVTQSAEGLKRGSRGTWDVKQVEVLRGPQSTLQGRNALAGAVVIETNDPTYDLEANVKAGFGSLDQKEMAFAFSGPLVADQVAVRLSGEFRDQESDVTFLDEANKPLGDDIYKNIRAKVLIEPEAIDKLTVLLSASHTFDNPSGIAATVTGPDYFARNFDSASTFTEFREMDVENYSADISYELTKGLVLRSITAQNDTDLKIRSAPASTFFVRADNREDDDFSQEFRLELNQENNNLSGVVGLFFGDFSQTVDSNITVAGTVYQDGTFENETRTKAVYADLRYKMFNRISFIGGARYQKDEVHNLIDITSAFGPTFTDRESDYSVFLPKYGLAFDINEQQTIAFTASRGYRQGFTEIVAGSTNQTNAVSPEFMWAYEIAYRLVPESKHFQLGVNFFYNKYSNQQITIQDPLFAPLANTFSAGKSTSYGAEVEGRYRFTNGLDLFGSIGLLKTKIGNFNDDSCTNASGSCEGNEYPGAPSLTASLGGIYQHSSGFFASIDANYTGDYYTFGDINNNANLEIESRFLANASLGYQTGDIRTSLYVENLFDRDYLTNVGTTGNDGSVGDARMVGIEVLVRY